MELTFDKKTLSSKITEIGNEIEKIITDLKKEKIEVIKLYHKLSTKYAELYLYYKEEYPIKLDKNEIKMFIEANDEYLKLNNAIKLKEMDIDILEKRLKNVENFRFDIKNYIEWEKMMHHV